MARPSFGRSCAGIRESIFRDVEVTEAGCERGDNAPARLPCDAVERRAAHPPPSSGRISTAPSCNTGSFFAIAMAASKSGTSIR